MSGLQGLPQELFVLLLDFLDVPDIDKLAETCKQLYVQIHTNHFFWAKKLRQKHGLEVYKNCLCLSLKPKFANGIIHVSRQVFFYFSKYYV